MIPAGTLTAAGLPRVRTLLAEMREDGIDAGSELGGRALDLWLSTPTDQACSQRGCFARLRRFEVLNGVVGGHTPECWPCTAARVRRIEAATTDKPRLAR